MEQRTYLAIDPGITTGYAYGLHIDKELRVAVWEKRDNVVDFYDTLRLLNPDFVIIENFSYRPGKHTEDRIEMFSLELIGVAELWVKLDREVDVPIYRQEAGEGKGHFTDDKMKEMGIHYRGIHHSRDAYRHLLHWFFFKRGYEFNNNPTISVVKRVDPVE